MVALGPEHLTLLAPITRRSGTGRGTEVHTKTKTITRQRLKRGRRRLLPLLEPRPRWNPHIVRESASVPSKKVLTGAYDDTRNMLCFLVLGR